MEVSDLTKLIKSDNKFLIKNYRLHDVKIVIDANNLAKALLERVKYQDRTDRVGVNLVAYGKQIEIFLDSLKNCNIEPILVFDGAQINDADTSTTLKKTEQLKETISDVGKLISPSVKSRCDPPPVVHPICTNMILKSIAIEKQLQVRQCFYEGEKYVAKMANDCDSPVLSGHSDFFIFNIKRGVILMDSFKFEDVKEQINDERSGAEIQSHFYIECELFEQGHFLKALPGFDKSCLPLIGGIAGNNASGKELYFLLFLVPRNLDSSEQDRLRMLIEFICNKSLDQSIDSLISLVEVDKREEIKALISESIKYYDLPDEDDFDKGISKHYKRAFCQEYWSKIDNDLVKANDIADREMRLLSQWVQRKLETSHLSKTCLELALRNIVFLRPEMDYFRKSKEHNCFKRYLSVLLAFTRSSHANNPPSSIYDREGDSIKMFELEPLLELENYDSIDYLIYDVCEDLSDDIVTTKLTQNERTAILLATFHSSPAEFINRVSQYYKFLKPQHAEEFAVLKLLVRYAKLGLNHDLEYNFRRSVLVTYLYYLHYRDSGFYKTNTADDANESYLDFLDNLRRLTYEHHLETIDQWNIYSYNITMVRNITQMQTAIRAYEELNAFLGTTLPTLRMHKWFNSCYIYKFAKLLIDNFPPLPTMPHIVDDS